MNTSGVLAGASVLVTRPAGREQVLCRRVVELGGTAEHLALMEIVPGSLDEHLSRLLGRIDSFDILIFVSVNAVQHGMALLRHAGSEIPRTAQLVAVGRATACALESHGFGGALYPEQRSNSEELLESDMLRQVDGARVLIVRGQDGRELLAETLRARGAEVEYAQVYERHAPMRDFAPILTRWLDTRCPMLVLTSDSGARVLLSRTPAGLRERMLEAPLALLSERQRDSCRTMGWRGLIGVCDATGDDGLIETLLKLFETHWRQDSR